MGVRAAIATLVVSAVLAVAVSAVHGWSVRKVGFDPAAAPWVRLQGTGPGPFSPLRARNWQHDLRYPLIAPAGPGPWRNIYAAQVVNNGGARNVYFGGWPGVYAPNDAIYVTVSDDEFQTFGPQV